MAEGAIDISGDKAYWGWGFLRFITSQQCIPSVTRVGKAFSAAYGLKKIEGLLKTLHSRWWCIVHHDQTDLITYPAPKDGTGLHRSATVKHILDGAAQAGGQNAHKGTSAEKEEHGEGYGVRRWRA